MGSFNSLCSSGDVSNLCTRRQFFYLSLPFVLIAFNSSLQLAVKVFVKVFFIILFKKEDLNATNLNHSSKAKYELIYLINPVLLATCACLYVVI